MCHLITQTLLSDWLYFISYGEEEDFLLTLNRDKKPQNENMITGLQLEKNIEEVIQGKELNNSDDDYIRCVRELAGITENGIWQVSGSIKKEIDGDQFLLYGRCDVLSFPYIYDIKYTQNYYDGKYFKKLQHKMYLEIFNLPRFAYLITDGINVYNEVYLKKDTDSIIPEIRNFWNWLKIYPKYQKIYMEKWNSIDDLKKI